MRETGNGSLADLIQRDPHGGTEIDFFSGFDDTHPNQSGPHTGPGSQRPRQSRGSSSPAVAKVISQAQPQFPTWH